MVLKASGRSRLREVTGALDRLVMSAGDHPRERRRQRRRSDPVLGPAHHQGRHADRIGALGLIGEPHRLGADAKGGGVDAAHGLDDFAANRGIGGLGDQHVRAPLREHAHVLARGDRAFVDRRAVGMRGEAVGEDQRRAGVGRGVVDRDRDDSAERKPADVGLGDAQRRHRRHDRRGIIVAGGAFTRRIAVAITGIVESDRAPFFAKAGELRMPHRLVRADAVQEDDRGLSPLPASSYPSAIPALVCDAEPCAYLGSIGPATRASLTRMTRMIINGEPLDYRLDPETPLLWALRDASNLTGTKYGCDSRDCGACTVIVDGRAALSCGGRDPRPRRRAGDDDRGPRRIAPGAAGVACRAGDDVRLLRARVHHGHRRPAGGEPEPERRADRRAAEHLPVRRLPADSQGDPPRGAVAARGPG